MSSPVFSADAILEALAGQPQCVRGGGRAVMIVSARRKEGVTTVARAVAQSMGPGAIYAVDLDLKRNALAKALSETGALGPKIDGRLGGATFYDVRAANGMLLREAVPVFTYHRVAKSRVFAGIFDARSLPQGARISVSSRADYWINARTGGAGVVVDAPALERSKVALKVARHMDGVVLVVGAEPGAAPAAIAAKAALVAAGANVIGLVYAGATGPVMAMERLLRQAG